MVVLVGFCPSLRFEFLTASKKLGFDDAAGAWLDLDKDGPAKLAQ